MTSKPEYPIEVSDGDNGTMQENVTELAEAVIGHKIVNVDFNVPTKGWWGGTANATVITLDNGKQVELQDTDDCCAFTELRAFLLNIELVNHVITGVGTTDEYHTWHIFADFGDVLALTVGWSCGNPFYYSYGFEIKVKETTIEAGETA